MSDHETKTWDRLTDAVCPVSKTFFFRDLWSEHWTEKASFYQAHSDAKKAQYAEGRAHNPPYQIALIDGIYCEHGGDCLGCCMHSWGVDPPPPAVRDFVEGLTVSNALQAFPKAPGSEASFSISTQRDDWETTRHELLFTAAHHRRNTACIVFWLGMITAAITALIPSQIDWPAFIVCLTVTWTAFMVFTLKPPAGSAPKKKDTVEATTKQSS